MVPGLLGEQAVPRPEPYGHGAGGPSFRVQQDPGLRRPAAHGPSALLGSGVRGILFRRGRVRRGRQVGPGARTQLGGPADVPQVPVQVEAEPPVGVGMRMTAGRGIRPPGTVPQGEADPLARVRPGRRSPGHEVHCAYAVPSRLVVAGRGDRQARAQQSVGSDPRHVPAQQVGSQVAQVVPEEGRQFTAVGPRHGPWGDIDIDARRGAGSCPVPGTTPGGRGLDHGGRYGEFAYARPEGREGVPVRDPSEHQHSPCADGSPILFTEYVVIAEERSAPR